MILVVGGIKGGSGKTTLATNLCQMRAAMGKKVLLVDADDQGSAHEWYLQRDANGSYSDLSYSARFVMVSMTGRTVYSNLIKMQHDYDDIIVDSGGRDSVSQRAAISAADTVLLPFRPRSLDVWTLCGAKRLIEECVNDKIKAYAVINQADSKGKNNSEALDVLQECNVIKSLPLFIGNRVAFANASAQGLGIFELIPRDEKACKEMQDLHDAIYA